MSLLKDTIFGVSCLATMLHFGYTLESKSHETRVFNGRPTHFVEYPYMLSLVIRTCYSGKKTICNAVIIGDYWALSTGQCTGHCRKKACFITARAESTYSEVGGNVYACESLFVHPEFTQVGREGHDISLLRTGRTITNGSFARAIALPASPPPVRTLASSCGWAYAPTCDPELFDKQLKEVALRVIDSTLCERIINHPDHIIKPSMLCAGILPHKQGMSHGDSGAPLVANDTLIGVLSHGAPCDATSIPHVYTNVSNLRGWIKDISQI